MQLRHCVTAFSKVVKRVISIPHFLLRAWKIEAKVWKNEKY